MEITARRKDDFAIVEVTGKIVRDNQVELRSRLEELIASGIKGMALDFANVHYLDSAGMGCCVSVQKDMNQKNRGMLVVFGASPDVEKVWKLIRLDLVIPLFPNEDDALARLRVESSV
jgi:anti-sigma B factor antagonist